MPAVTLLADLTASFSREYAWAVLNIMLIDVVLAGDNAVVIALAVHALPAKQRLAGIVMGTSLAVLLRVGLTFVVSQLLALPLLKLVGGGLVVWIALKLVWENEPAATPPASGTNRFWRAVVMILAADLMMSVDNVIAVAGASHGSFGLLLFGLALSIPLVVFASNLLSKLMDRWPVIIDLGAALLGEVGVSLMLDDPKIVTLVPLSGGAHHVMEWGSALAVLTYARWRRMRTHAPAGQR